jgi:alpha-D-ribose 1-methylphosphonate 5-triphosphate diphosphatase
MQEQIFTNAWVVLANDVLEGGSVVTRDGMIVEIDRSPSRTSGAFDFGGDLLIPGLVELHTDNVERHIMPRPGAHWPADAAMLAHDREIAASGITTVLNALCVGEVHSRSARLEILHELHAAMEDMRAADAFKADHYLHWRCEISYGGLRELLEPLMDYANIKLVSVMDHTPGQRQFMDIRRYAEYYQGKFGMSDAELQAFIDQRKADQERHSTANRAMVVEWSQARGIPLASHDDATASHVNEAVRDRMAIAEFPTTVEAARASHEGGLAVLMGGPNIVRGKSHSGNIAARELGELGVLDIISSDYVPASLLYGALTLEREVEAITLPQAIATVTKNPARACGFTDRGEIAIGQRADLVRVRPTNRAPVVRDVWRLGEKVA